MDNRTQVLSRFPAHDRCGFFLGVHVYEIPLASGLLTAAGVRDSDPDRGRWVPLSRVLLVVIGTLLVLGIGLWLQRRHPRIRIAWSHGPERKLVRRRGNLRDRSCDTRASAQSTESVNAEIDRIEALPSNPAEVEYDQASSDWAQLDHWGTGHDAPLILVANDRSFTLVGSRIGGTFVSDQYGLPTLNTVYVKNGDRTPVRLPGCPGFSGRLASTPDGRPGRPIVSVKPNTRRAPMSRRLLIVAVASILGAALIAPAAASAQPSPTPNPTPPVPSGTRPTGMTTQPAAPPATDTATVCKNVGTTLKAGWPAFQSALKQARTDVANRNLSAAQASAKQAGQHLQALGAQVKQDGSQATDANLKNTLTSLGNHLNSLGASLGSLTSLKSFNPGTLAPLSKQLSSTCKGELTGVPLPG